MAQSTAVMISIALCVIAAVITWYCFTHIDSDLTMFGVIGIAWFVALGSWAWSADDNFYDVKSGIVIGQKFTPAYVTPVICSTSNNVPVCSGGQYIPDDWAIEIRGGDGKTGKIHFGNNVFTEYPNGSHYPHR